MKIQVRKGVYETNSSSTHSIAVSKEKGLKLDLPKKVVFDYGEFGWEEKSIHSTKDKASYLYTALYYLYLRDQEKWKEYITFIFNTLTANGVDCEFKGEIKQGISAYSHIEKGVEKPYIYFFNEIGDYCYIDHGSEAVPFVHKICSDEQLLLSYLFSKHSFILTGNDNSGTDVSVNLDYEYELFYKGN